MNVSKASRRGVLKLGGVVAVTAATGVSATAYAAGSPQRFYLGTYTSAGGPGIVRGHLDAATGKLTVDARTNAVQEASWLATGPGRTTLYAISEQAAGTVGTLGPDDLVVRATVATGNGPAHIAVHPGGTFLFSSLYGGGAVVTHPIGADGTVGPATDARNQSASGQPSHAHQVVVDPTGGYVLAVDLGRDSVFTYTLNTSAKKLTQVARTAMVAGSGPRHLVFHPSGSFAYLANENNSTVTVLGWANGVLTPGRSLPAAPSTGVTNYPGEIAISADGRFVYVSNRGTNTVGVFAVSAGGATLTRIAAPACGGDWPRHLALDATGRWLYVANQRSGTVTWLPVNAGTGVPGPVAGTFAAPGAAQMLLV
jgi:6-phosphogluconolactonase (cycloisomerase 2 family)